MRWHKANCGRRGERPEAANGHAKQCASQHIKGIALSHGDNQTGDGHQCRQAQQQRFAVNASRKRREKQAGQYGQRAGYRDPEARQAFTDGEIPQKRASADL